MGCEKCKRSCKTYTQIQSVVNHPVIMNYSVIQERKVGDDFTFVIYDEIQNTINSRKVVSKRERPEVADPYLERETKLSPVLSIHTDEVN